MSEVARIDGSIEGADPRPADADLLALVYEELRRLAAARMAGEAAGHTLQPTALVHEAWLRLAGSSGGAQFANRAHFFAAASEAMRRILIDRARRKLAQKRDGGRERIDLDEVEIAVDANDATLVLVSEALEKLKLEDARAAELVTLRFFGGLKLTDAGEVLGISERTAKRCWAFARAWLYDELAAATEN